MTGGPSTVPSAPVLEPRAWLGAELKERRDWCHRLGDAEVDELLRALDLVVAKGLRPADVTVAGFPLPTFGARLAAVARRLRDGRGFALLRGLPTGALSLDELRLLFLGVAAHLGLPVPQSSRGGLADSVRDEGRPYVDGVRGYETNAGLSYHADSTDVVGLLCITPARHGGVSRIVSAVEVHNAVLRERPDLLEVLYEEPLFYSWKGEGPPDHPPFYWGRLFSWYGGELRTRWSYDLLRATQRDYPEVPRLTARQEEALALVDAVANRPQMALDMQFRSGDAQFLRNDTVWHARTPFEDGEGAAERRHLLRVWLNFYEPLPTAPDFENRYTAVGEAARWPKRRVFPVGPERVSDHE